MYQIEINGKTFRAHNVDALFLLVSEPAPVKETENQRFDRMARNGALLLKVHANARKVSA